MSAGITPARIYTLRGGDDRLSRGFEQRAYWFCQIRSNAQGHHRLDAEMIRKSLFQALRRKSYTLDRLHSLEGRASLDENVIECLANPGFCRQPIPSYKRLHSTKLLHAGPQRIDQFLKQTAVGGAIEIPADQIGNLI